MTNLIYEAQRRKNLKEEYKWIEYRADQISTEYWKSLFRSLLCKLRIRP